MLDIYRNRPSLIIVNDNDGRPFSEPPYVPSQIFKAYDFDDRYQGKGQTIALVVAYGNPNILDDLDIFNRRFGIPKARISIIYPQGRPTDTNLNWVLETSLDVEWSHALAPLAEILLVVAKDQSADNLFDAANFAVQSGASIVSMSFGFDESLDQLQYDKVFEQSGVVFLAASGDIGLFGYPSSSPNVIGVGGTSLQLDPCGNRIKDEIGWFGSAGGISNFEQKPPWEYINSNAVPKTAMRTIPDVSFYADIFPGINVYASINEDPRDNWFTVSGTSIGSPCWAAIFACAIPENRRLYNAPALMYEIAGGCNYTNKYKAFIDVTNGNTMYYGALVGYDYVTGLGSPRVDKLIEAVSKLGDIR